MSYNTFIGDDMDKEVYYDDKTVIFILNNVKSIYSLKRPKTGYNTEKERAYAKWSGVSDWELFYKKKLIGQIWYTGTSSPKWGGELNVPEFKTTYEHSKQEVFYQLANQHHGTK